MSDKDIIEAKLAAFGIGTKAKSRKEKPNEGNSQYERMVMPIELCNIPGVVHDHAAYTMWRSRYPNVRTATIGALAMVSFAAARGYRTESNLRTPLYLVAAANSGAGKDEPRKTNIEIAQACGALECVGDTIASGEGLEDFILERGKVLLQYDEFDTLLNAINADKGGNKETMVNKMLSVFSAAGSFMSRRKTANNPNKASGNTYAAYPSLTLFASAVPEMLFKALSERTMENGLVARCLIADCGIRQPRNRDARYGEIPRELIDRYQTIFGTLIEDGRARIPDVANVKRNLKIVGFSSDAEALIDAIEDEWDKRYHGFDNGEGQSANQSMAARTIELAIRCSMCYAISERPEDPEISVSAVKWAKAFVEYCQDSMIRSMTLFSSRNEFDDNMKRIMRMFGREKRRTKREISRGLRLPIKDVEELLLTLVSNGDLVDDGTGTVYEAV